MSTMAAIVITGAASISMSAVGAIGQGMAASSEAKGQQAIADYNARVAEQNAKATEQATAIKQNRMAEDANRRASSLQAKLAAAGVVPSAGTPLQIQSEQAKQSELDNLMTGYQGMIAANQQRSQGAIDRAQAMIYGQQAGNYATAGFIGAGTSLLKGFGTMANQNDWFLGGSGGGSYDDVAAMSAQWNTGVAG